MEDQAVQDIDVEFEMKNIMCAGFVSASDLKEKAFTLLGLFEIESDAPTATDVSVEMANLIRDYDDPEIGMSDDIRDTRLASILAKVLTAQDRPTTPQL